MRLPLFWIDAFTSQTFGGNPAAVVLLEAWPADVLLQRIAFENGLSETAFFRRTGPNRGELRWFTPAVEVDLCGHATLATAYALFTELHQPGSELIFDTRSGALAVHRRGELLEMDFPARAAHAAPTPTELSRGLGAIPQHVEKNDRVWLCVFASEAEVTALRPDAAALQVLEPGRIIVTAPGRTCDFVSRFFAYAAGIPEDPVTGSSHCTLVPYWAQRLGRDRLHARQVSRRGGELWCELAGERVRIAGRAVLYLRGEIDV